MEMVGYQRKKMKRADAASVSMLSFHFIAEILSWLPVKSLIRFKCASKRWYSLIDRDYNFIAKHMGRVSLLQLNCVCKPEGNKLSLIFDKNFKLLAYCDGLMLENSLSNSRVFRIRNPASHQVLYLPLAHERIHKAGIAFNSSTHECKVLCYYGSDTGVGLVGFEVLTIGKDDQWRPLKHPNEDLMKRSGIFVVEYYMVSTTDTNSGGDGRLFQFINDGQGWSLEIHCLDILNECFTTNTVPQAFLVDMRNLWIFYWNKRVALADIGEGKLNMLVLEDYKEHKWSKNEIIVPMNFLKYHMAFSKDRLISIESHSDELKFCFRDTTVYYDAKRNIIKVKYTQLPNNNRFSCKQNLISLKGMKSEKAASCI